jgi:glycerate kinase
LADGGEGTLEALAAAGGWDWMPAAAKDPLMRTVGGRFLRQGDRAVVELAVASGLSRVARDERDAGAATTFGTGQILAAAIGLGCDAIVLGLGGSATTDGGSGLLRALGARFLDARGEELPPGGLALAGLATIDLSELSPVLGEVRLTIASDVSNRLLGPIGAAATFGPQKGADPAMVERLDAALGHYADLLEQATSTDARQVPGAGAAGGTTFGLLAIADRFASFEVRPGVELVMELTDFDGRLRACDLVLTGEGRVDEQTAFGKTALGVARRAADAGVRCICFGGGVQPAGEEALLELGCVTLPVVEAPMTVEEAMGAGPGPIERAAERAARLVSPGRAPGE